MALTRLVVSNDYDNFEAFSEALAKEYSTSYRPSAVKILAYPDGSLAAIWGEQGYLGEPVENPKKLFYASMGEDVSEEISKLNVKMNVDFEGMRVSKPYIEANGYSTVVFVVAEKIEDIEDDFDDEDDEDDDDIDE